MPSLHTQKLARWGRVAVVAAVVIAAAGAFVLITPSYELDSEAFLSQVFAQNAEVRSVHFTQFGSVTMSDGDVLYWSGEGDIVHTGDSQGHIEYEGCSFPIGSFARGVRLCSIEWVELEGMRYERQNTSESSGEWEIVENVQATPSDSDTSHDPAEIPEYWSRAYGLVELNSEIIDGVEYRRFRTSYNPSWWLLKRLKAGESEPPAGVPRETLIEILERQAEMEVGTRELWARADDSVIWKIIDEVEGSDANERDPLRAPITRKTFSTLEYSRYNEPVVIKPPI